MFVDNLRIWYAQKYSTQDGLIAAFDRKDKRILNYLEQEFSGIYKKYQQIEYVPNQETPKKIWLMWWQGENNMPPVSKACTNLIKRHVPDYEINIITKYNYNDYLCLDDVVGLLDKKFLGKPRMIIQYLSDIIRMRLLSRYGGIWIDSTVFVSESSTIREIEQLPFFTVRLNDPRDHELISSPRKGFFSEFFIASSFGNPFFCFVDECLTFHIKRHKSSWDYLLNEYVILIGIKHVPFIRHLFDSVGYSNPRLYWLGNHIHDKFDSSVWNKVNEDTHIFKLSNHDAKEERIDREEVTYYKYFIMNQI